MEKMNNPNNTSIFFKRIQSYFINNLRYITIIFSLILLLFFSFQAYNYYQIQELKKTSINFFKYIENNDQFLNNLNELKKGDNIFSTLTNLKLIEINNDQKKFKNSNELYKVIIINNKLDPLYKSSIAAHASYTLINASYIEDSNIYIKDIEYFIDNISSDIDSFYSIKKELEFILKVTELDINKSNYNNNSTILNIYNEIVNSPLISDSVKERVKKIHEFHLYK